MNLTKLSEPFTDDDLEWRVANVFNNNKLSAKILVYVTNRAIMARLDEVCGVGGWQNEYTALPGAFLCGISIKCGDEWVTKWDGAQESQIEATKGGLSGAMKRAAVQWGIGRYLYEVKEVWADINDNGKYYQGAKQGKYPAFKWNAPSLNNGTTQGRKPADDGRAFETPKQLLENCTSMTDLQRVFKGLTSAAQKDNLAVKDAMKAKLSK